MESLNWYKKVSIVLIIIITTYLLFRFLQSQRNLYEFQSRTMSVLDGGAGINEGFGGVDDNINFMMINDSGAKTKNTNYTDYPSLTLKDYVVKSSYNTAYIGSSMSFKAITYALSRGYRFLDFEVFFIDGLPCVGYNSNSATPMKITSSNTLPFGQVLYNVVTEAFSAPTPNINDPLFINLRLNSKDNSLYEMVAKSIDKNINNRLYQGKVDSTTKLVDIIGKIVLIVDVTKSPDYDSYPTCASIEMSQTQCYNLSKYVNIEGGSKMFQLVTYDSLLNQTTNPPNVNTKNGETDLTVLKMTYPDITMGKENPAIKPFIKNYGTQFVAVRLNNLDTNLKNYESFFGECGYGIVPYSVALKNIEP